MKSRNYSIGDIVLWAPHPSIPAEVCMVVGGVDETPAIMLQETSTGTVPSRCAPRWDFVEVLFTSDGTREWIPVDSLVMIIRGNVKKIK